MRAASSSGEGDSDRVSHPKRIDASKENSGGENLSRRREKIADGGGDREQPGIFAGEARDLQAQRRALGGQQRQRQGRDTEHRGGHVEDRVAGRAEPDWSST